MSPCPRLGPEFFDRPVLEVAPDLLGCLITHNSVTIRLTEVEAYDGERDPGSHAFRGRTARNAVRFGPAGYLYVYRHLGLHVCANVVTGEAGRASAQKDILLAESQHGLVQLRDRWVLVDPARTRAMLEHRSQEITALEALRAAVTGAVEVDDVRTQVDTEGWLDAIPSSLAIRCGMSAKRSNCRAIASSLASTPANLASTTANLASTPANLASILASIAAKRSPTPATASEP